jgi:hypothetical protein
MCHAGLFAGLTPILEAVAELPAGGLPLPNSAQAQVRQYFSKYKGATAAASSNANTQGDSTLGFVQPSFLKTTLELQEHLLHVAGSMWQKKLHPASFSPDQQSTSAAAQLVGNAVNLVAQQLRVEQGSPACRSLMAEGFRAGED